MVSAVVVVVLLCLTNVSAIWPQPVEMSTGSQVSWLDPGIKAYLRCNGEEVELFSRSLGFGGNPLLNMMNGVLEFTQALFDTFPFYSRNKTLDGDTSFSELSILQTAAREAITSIQSSRFVPWKLHKRKSSFEPDAEAPRHHLSVLQIQQSTCPSQRAFHPPAFLAGDESYEIIIDHMTALIKSNCTAGSLRGLQTFTQLYYAHSTFTGSYIPNTPVRIVDYPKWRHRGLSIDIARNVFYPKDLLRTIDAMAMTKMNRLHIHATDSQSWPLEIPSLPALAEQGAYQPQLIWTAASLEEIQVHGASKGISVFVEIDMPGHTASVAHSYPDLITAFNELDWSTFAAEPLSGQLKLNSSAVYDFVTTLLQDLLSRSRPYTSLYHIGGDEVNRAAYLLDDTVRSDEPRVLQPLLQKFMDHVISITSQYGFQPIVWEEMLLDWNLTLPSVSSSNPSEDILVQVWRDSGRIEEVLKKGHRAIFGDYKHWYLDCK